MTCAQIQSEAGGLAALSAEDPQRAAAFAHARTCPACAAALGEGVAMIGLLQMAAPLAAPTRAQLERAAAEIRADLPQARSTLGPRPVVAIVAASLAAWILPLAGGLRLVGGQHPGRSVLLAILFASLSAGSLALGGWSVAALPLASLGASFLFGVSGAWNAAHGLHCLGFELLTAAVPLVAAFSLARRGVFRSPATALATAAAAGALMGQAALEVTCPVLGSYGHLGLFHTGGVVLALGLGVFAARLVGRTISPAQMPR